MSLLFDPNMMNMFVPKIVLGLSVSRIVEGSVSFGERLSHHHSHCAVNP